MALAVISPALDPADHAAEATPPAEHTDPEHTAAHLAETEAARAALAERASRADPRRPAGDRPALPRRVAAAQLALSTVAGDVPLPEMSPETYEELRRAAVVAATALAVADDRVALRGPAAEAAAEAREILRDAVAEPSDAPANEARDAQGAGARRPGVFSAQMAQAHAARLAGALSATTAEQIRDLRGGPPPEQPAGTRAAPARRAIARAVVHRVTPRAVKRLHKRVHRTVQKRIHNRIHRSVKRSHVVTSRRTHHVMPLGNGMTAVIAYARSQVGKRYVRGGTGPFGFDCSGFTKRAYALAGIELPHSSGAQAAQARSISRAEARPGDLVVGPGHVGIYMGRGMMIDAGNSRTGVVYRRLYSGLHVERLK
ncbi:C40 family peptidase [Paractinoplanes deccanensis]|nr:C40 family peptidase [Actinoplanes deccanensis]